MVLGKLPTHVTCITMAACITCNTCRWFHLSTHNAFLFMAFFYLWNLSSFDTFQLTLVDIWHFSTDTSRHLTLFNWHLPTFDTFQLTLVDIWHFSTDTCIFMNFPTYYTRLFMTLHLCNDTWWLLLLQIVCNILFFASFWHSECCVP